MSSKLARGGLSHSGFIWPSTWDARFRNWQKLACSATWSNLIWDSRKLGISTSGREAAISLGFYPSQVFAHPDVLSAYPELSEYYRLMACLSKESVGQFGPRSPAKVPLAQCRFLNWHLSYWLNVAAKASRDSRFNPIFVAAAKQQGNWADTGLQAVQEDDEFLVNDSKQ